MVDRSSYDPGPRISHAGSINIGTPNLQKSLWFFRDVLGLEVTAETDGVAYLRGYHEKVHHSLVLTQGETTINTLGFRVARQEDVELFHEQFATEELEVRYVPAGTEVGRGEAIRLLIPGGGHPIELYFDIDKPEAPEEIRSLAKNNSSRRRGLGVQRFDHLNVMTDPGSMHVAEGWLRDSLGFKRREYATHPQIPGAVIGSWLSVNSKLHDIAIGAAPGGEGQFHHVAFAVENINDLLVAAEEFKDLGVQIDAGPGRHGIGQGAYLYVRDPGSGHRIELYAGGIPFFEPDWEATEWSVADTNALTWVGDLPNLDPATSTYLSTTSVAGLELPVPATV